MDKLKNQLETEEYKELEQEILDMLWGKFCKGIIIGFFMGVIFSAILYMIFG